MKKVKKYIVYALFLPACIVAETIIIKLFDITDGNIWAEGTKVGFIVWLVFLFTRNKYQSKKM